VNAVAKALPIRRVPITTIFFTFLLFGLAALRRRVCKREEKSGDFQQHKGNIIRGVTVAPDSNSVQNLLLHFRQRQTRSLGHDLLEALHSQHFAPTIETLGQAIRVNNDPITTFESRLENRFGFTADGVFEEAKDHVRRFEQLWRLSGANDDCRRMTCSSEL
jgi:hypothetical protein